MVGRWNFLLKQSLFSGYSLRFGEKIWGKNHYNFDPTLINIKLQGPSSHNYMLYNNPYHPWDDCIVTYMNTIKFKW